MKCLTIKSQRNWYMLIGTIILFSDIFYAFNKYPLGGSSSPLWIHILIYVVATPGFILLFKAIQLSLKIDKPKTHGDKF